VRKSSKGNLRVGVIGAGPYGLSAAAFLRAAGLKPLVFGDTMKFWQDNMPEGMLLRSGLRDSSIASPGRSHPLERWASEERRELALPIPLEDFRDYAHWYQRRLVPDVDPRRVAQLRRANGGLALTLGDGEETHLDSVVVAAGLEPFPRIPAQLSTLPSSLMSHSSQHRDLGRFRSQHIAVLGSGQSALESAALLHEAGARVEVIHRAAAIKWLSDPRTPGKRKRVYWRSAPTGICGPRSSWITAAPDLFRNVPSRVRERVRGCAGPAGGYWLRERVVGIPIMAQRTISDASPVDGRLRLELDDGSERVVDHLLLGTGYRVDISGYSFLSEELVNSIETSGGFPILRPGLESSVPGLHFIGASAAYTFGPVMRFVTGSWYTAPAVTRGVLRRWQPPLSWAF
jgi:hypothetical protein